MKLTRLRIPIALLAVMVLLVFSSMAFAAHGNVPLRDASGTLITNGTTPYSPKQTCSGCHFDCTSGAYSATRSTWCQTDAAKKDCTTVACPDYQSAETTTVSKKINNKASDGTWTAKTFDVKVPMHGASVGKHSTEGRNEGFVDAQRTTWSSPKTATSPGMSGRF